MLFYMNDGTAQIARKKCNCKNHLEPHWIYLNNEWKRRNRQIKGINQTIEEIKRLKALEREMRKHDVLEIYHGYARSDMGN